MSVCGMTVYYYVMYHVLYCVCLCVHYQIDEDKRKDSMYLIHRGRYDKKVLNF